MEQFLQYGKSQILLLEKDGLSVVKHILLKSHNSCFTHPPEAILSPAQGKRTSTFQLAIILAQVLGPNVICVSVYVWLWWLDASKNHPKHARTNIAHANISRNLNE